MSTEDRQNRNSVFNSNKGVPRRDVLKEDFDFDVPVENIPLPSLGKTYPTDSPLHGQDSVAVRAMTAKEEDILTSRALIKKGTVITHLIQSCLIDKSINVRSALSGDRNALMVGLRVTGYGAEYSADVECPECAEKSGQTFDLSQLPIRSLEIDPVQPGENVFEFELPLTKKKVNFRFLTGADEEEIMVTNERKKKTGMTNSSLVTTRLMYSIVSVGGITDKAKISTFIRNMPARDSLALRKYIDQHEPGIDMVGWMECPHCYEHSEVKLPLGATFFWPDS